jgi:hypothetical protein
MENPNRAVRRVWRMTADCPMGKVVELVAETPEAEPPKPAVPASDSRDEVQARLLDPAKVPNWQSSSFDLLTGLTVRDLSDIIPGKIFTEVFQSDRRLMRRKHF